MIRFLIGAAVGYVVADYMAQSSARSRTLPKIGGLFQYNPPVSQLREGGYKYQTRFLPGGVQPKYMR